MNLEPPIPIGILAPGVRSDVLGMSPYGPKPFDRLAPGEKGTAVLWEVYDFGGGKYGVAMEPTLGRGTIHRSKNLRSTSRATSWKRLRPRKPSSTSIIKKLSDGTQT